MATGKVSASFDVCTVVLFVAHLPFLRLRMWCQAKRKTVGRETFTMGLSWTTKSLVTASTNLQMEGITKGVSLGRQLSS